ncbi:hypothetical protein [Quadrisphaera sp. INWT6]|uniref:hypothetical protein n=1 Tax=Quadrisphaera sp. INWT6 TaxID=2596917 RepID=UPI0018923D5E|nr:hypothetical protein [Quadrisphaera sp. INWT6]MBF5082308.1 hypothetical protein [Quadrisphaera sp. INWT6]
MPAPAALEREHTLLTAAARYDALRRQELDDDAGVDRALRDPSSALELLALSEVVVRKAVYGRQLTVRAARAAGASWSQIGQALGTSKQAAWEGHQRWIDEQAAQHARVDHTGMDDDEVSAARDLAGPDSDR